MYTLRRPPRLALSLALIALSLVFLPLNVYVLFSSYVLQVLSPFARARRGKIVATRRVLISGVNNAVGLALARNLYLRGHHVIGADYEKYNLGGIGRHSKAIRKFYSVPGLSKELGAADYVHKILDIVKQEKVDIFISCASFTTPAEDAITKSVVEKLTDCKCIAFEPEIAAQLSSKPAFLDLAKSIGLTVPEIHSVTSRDQIHKVLGPAKRKERSFTLSKARTKRPSLDASGNTLLPQRSVSQTYQFVSQLKVSNDDPYVLEEHITGEEYCSYVLMMEGFIEAFVACIEPTGHHIKRLQVDSPLYYAILRLTKLLTTKLPEKFSGPLTFSFRVQMLLTTSGFEKKLIPRACMPKIGLPSLLLEPSLRTTTSKSATSNGATSNGDLSPIGLPSTTFSSQGNFNVYWVATDFLDLVLYPVYDVVRWRKSLHQLWISWQEFTDHVLFWREATFVLWDPMPFFWQYSILWPCRLAAALLHHEKWNILDITTNELR